MTTFNKQGNILVARDKEGRVLEKVLSKDPKTTRETWRVMLRRMTNDSEDLLGKLVSIANGEPFVGVLKDGRETEPVIPSIESQRAAATELLHMLHGKPVTQTEVIKAEEQTKELDRLRAMSDAELDIELAKIIAEERAKGKFNEVIGSDPRLEVDAVPAAPELPDSKE